MRWLLLAIGVLAGLTVLLTLVGTLIPRNHRATSRARLSQPPDLVWPVVRDLAGVARWWPDVKRVEAEPAEAGVERWRQTFRTNFELPIRVVESEPPSRLKTVIEAGPGAPFGGSWTYDVAGVDGGTLVSITEDGWIGNPIFRLFSRVMGYHGTMDSYLGALGRRFGETVRPEHP